MTNKLKPECEAAMDHAKTCECVLRREYVDLLENALRDMTYMACPETEEENKKHRKALELI